MTRPVRVLAQTTAGAVTIEIHPAWSPHGAARILELIAARYYDDTRFFRVVAGRWAQFGIAGTPAVAQAWRHRTIQDDPLLHPNHEGTVAFANTGPGTRSTQLYINLADNAARLDHEPGFAPVGRVTSGMDVVHALHAGYGETAGGGMRAGRQDALFTHGNAHLDAHFPKLDRLVTLSILA